MQNVILIRYGEVHLKGKNRPFFLRKLYDSIKRAVSEIDGIRVEKAQGRLYVKNYESSDEQKIIDSLKRVFGIVSISPALSINKDINDIKKTALDLIQNSDLYKQRGNDENISFKIESRRADKTFEIDSMEISREVGAYILNNLQGMSVDVKNPQIKVSIEVRESALLYYNGIKAAGGMPTGTNGRAVLLLSGGIDSPVAGYMIAKRGVSISALHFHSFPYTSERAKEKVIKLGKILSEYCGGLTLNIVHFTKIQQQLYQKCPDSQITVLMRRYMMMIAERVAKKNNSKAIITGESIGQVASQTLDSLAVTNSAVNMPVFRPLIGFDKIDIMNLAKNIGTYETSILPYEDCCTVFVPKHPVTHPKLSDIIHSEELINKEELIDEAIANIETLKL